MKTKRRTTPLSILATLIAGACIAAAGPFITGAAGPIAAYPPNKNKGRKRKQGKQRPPPPNRCGSHGTHRARSSGWIV